MIALLTTVHRWVGLTLGLVLLVVSLSGVLLLARAPYERWQHPSLARPITAADRPAHAAVLDRIRAEFGGQVRNIKLPQPGRHVFQVWLTDGSEAFVDAWSGRIVDRWRPTERLPALLFDVHAHLMAGERGEFVNGLVAALTVVFLALGGALVWWPRRRAMPLRAVWPRAWAPGPLLRSHAAVGVITCVPLLLFVVTGLGLAWAAWVMPALSGALDRQGPPAAAPRVVRTGGAEATGAQILEAIDRAFARPVQAERGGAPQPVFLLPGRAPDAPIVARVRLPGEWHPNGRSLVYVHPQTAAVLATVDARALGAGTRFGYALYPLHAARLGASASWPLVGAATLAGLGLAVLSVTGAVAWVQRSRLTWRRLAPARDRVNA